MGMNQGKLGPLFVELYTWMITIFFGTILLDIVYSKLVPEASAAFSEVSDFLLLIGFVTILAAVGAIALSWKSSIARNLFIASLISVSFEFLIPVFLSQFLKNAQGLSWVRILPSGMASILAFIGLYKYYRQK
jgi:hypothetical protein